MSYISISLLIIDGNHYRNSKKIETWKQELCRGHGGCLLEFCSPWLAQPEFFILLRTTKTGMASLTIGWGHPYQLLIKNIPNRFADNIIEAFSQMCFLSDVSSDVKHLTLFVSRLHKTS